MLVRMVLVVLMVLMCSSGVWTRAQVTRPTWSTPNSCCSPVCSTSVTNCLLMEARRLQVSDPVLTEPLSVPGLGLGYRCVVWRVLSVFLLPADVLDEEKFSVELVVQCIRTSDVPQTHHHALLLLGAVASIFPVSSASSVSQPPP